MRRVVDGSTVPRGVGASSARTTVPPRRTTERSADVPPMEPRRAGGSVGTTDLSTRESRMKAAVVHDYTRPLEIEEVPIPEPGAEQVLVRIEASRSLSHRHPRRARRVAGQAAAAVHPRPRGRRHRRARRPGQRARHRRGHARRAAVARLRLRRLRVLQHRLGDALRVPAEHGLLHERRLRRVRRRLRPPRRRRARRASTRSTRRR